MIHALPKANMEQTNRSIFGCKFLFFLWGMLMFFLQMVSWCHSGLAIFFGGCSMLAGHNCCWRGYGGDVFVPCKQNPFSMGVPLLCQEGWQGRGSRNVSCLHCRRRSSYLWRVMFCLFSAASRSTRQSLFEKHENRCSEVEGLPVGYVTVI